MKKACIFPVAVSLLMLSSNSRAAVDVSVFYGLRGGGEVEETETGEIHRIDDSTSSGVVIEYDLNDSQQIEFLYSHQESALLAGGSFTGVKVFDLDVDYYHIGGTYAPGSERWRPFVAMTVGLTRLTPRDARYEDTNRFSFAIAGGVKGRLVNHIAWHVEARGYNTVLESGTSIFCADGECTFSVSGNGYWQYELHAGLGVSF